jgi:glutamate--cysteine ligase
MTDANLLDRLQGEWSLLAESMLGLERETLRVTANASIAQTPHAKELGSALTHPFITTDYAEALLELITPPRADAGAALADLADAHRFAAARFSSELFWGASMPCRIDSPEQIALAWYGDSNPGRMKHVYRLGLGHRYGRMMQVISGVHVNFSLADRFWQFYNEAFADSRDDLRQVSSAGYFRMLRNLQRNGSLVRQCRDQRS